MSHILRPEPGQSSHDSQGTRYSIRDGKSSLARPRARREPAENMGQIKVEITDVKKEAFTAINPNGRLPAITDPNTGITLWESGAIIEYLVETYDTESRLSYTSFPEKFHLKQFLAFQMSGQVTSCPLLIRNDNSDGQQGPYFGQLGWFKMFHPEDVPSAKERYEEQTVRVLSVLDRVLKGREYLVGDKAYVLLSFSRVAHS